MSEQRTHVIVLGVCLALAAGVFWRRDPPAATSGPPDPHILNALPRSAQVVALIRLDDLRATELGSVLLGAGRKLPGVGSLSEVCGADPSERISDVAVALNVAGADGQLGIAARGQFAPAELADCARKVLTRRGGSPRVTRAGRFEVLTSSTTKASVGFAQGAPALLAEQPLLSRMMAAWDGREPSARSAPGHQRRLQQLGAGGAIVVSAEIGPDALYAFAGPEEVKRSPLAAVRGLAVRIDRDSASGALECESAEACATLQQFVERSRADLSALASAALGVDVTRALRTNVRGHALTWDLPLDPELVSRLLQRLTR